MKKPLLAIGLIAIFFIGGFFVLNSYIYNQKQRNPENIERYRGTLTGEYVCLPHKDTGGPQTLECAFGIKLDTGEYYAVDFNLMSQGLPDIQIGDRFSATGTITPIEMLSTDQWQKYPVEGIFSITDSVKKL